MKCLQIELVSYYKIEISTHSNTENLLSNTFLIERFLVLYNNPV